MTSFSESLLRWYDQHQRVLPWRTQVPNPYHVWLSEVMLQQTTVKTVIPYFTRFIQNWPAVADLARSSLDEVLGAWQGLGYYSRARNLHACAKRITAEYKGRFPSSERELLSLPGIGPYTAAAISSIAFNQPAAAVDGNVIRVMSRYYSLLDPRHQLERIVQTKVKSLLPQDRFSDFTQALMELGAVVCRPKSPHCDCCPLKKSCLGVSSPELYPAPKEKKTLPTRYAIAYMTMRSDGAIFLQKRPEKGLLGGMMEVPTTPWLNHESGVNLAHVHAPFENLQWKCLKGEVKHTFSHFHFSVRVWLGGFQGALEKNEGVWVQPQALDNYALPTIMKKIIRHGLENDEVPL